MPSGHPIQFSKKLEQNIIHDYVVNELSANAISKKHGIKCSKSITKILRKNKIHILSRYESVSRVNTIIFDYEEQQKIIIMNQHVKITLSDISKELNCDPQTIKKFLISINQYDKNKLDKYLIKKFNIIDTEEKAYWLGFLTADGSVSSNQLSLALAEKDLAHVEAFKKFIGIDCWKISKTKTLLNNKLFYGYRYVVSSKKFVESLKKHNIFNNKSFTTSIPNTVPPNLIRHYIRGIIDGDGSFYITNEKIKRLGFSLISSIVMCEQIQKILMKNCELNKTKLQIMNYIGGNMAYLRYGGNQQITRISNFIYDNSTIYLDRKKQVVNKFWQLK